MMHVLRRSVMYCKLLQVKSKREQRSHGLLDYFHRTCCSSPLLPMETRPIDPQLFLLLGVSLLGSGGCKRARLKRAGLGCSGGVLLANGLRLLLGSWYSEMVTLGPSLGAIPPLNLKLSLFKPELFVFKFDMAVAARTVFTAVFHRAEEGPPPACPGRFNFLP
mmetsp:Transcript_47666/g.78934  ORF Transcript_47666/g.78934 Transcript_47666/m.78934 type:complete len:163 (-) Transcript_47666:254-742(-)